jgi:hypothetical protein
MNGSLGEIKRSLIDVTITILVVMLDKRNCWFRTEAEIYHVSKIIFACGTHTEFSDQFAVKILPKYFHMLIPHLSGITHEP